MENFIKLIEQCLMVEDTKKLEINLNFVQEIVSFVLNKIKLKCSLDEAQVEFSFLKDLQFVLSKASFKNNVFLPEQLKKFVYDFDRLDDKEMKEYLYSKIKTNKYYL